MTIVPVASISSTGLTGLASLGSPAGTGATGAAGSAQGTEAALGTLESPQGVGEAQPAGSSFGSALTEAISSLENTQRTADAASQSLAAGTAKDPESAVTTVEDAALEMQLAAQLRSKATEAAQTIFQTQV